VGHTCVVWSDTRGRRPEADILECAVHTAFCVRQLSSPLTPYASFGSPGKLLFLSEPQFSLL
jgi:hypothetical protein